MESRNDEPDQARLAEGADLAAAADRARRAEAGGRAETAAAGARGRALEDLRWNWEQAYEISWSDGRFRAGRLDGRGGVEAATAQDLRDLVLAGCTASPVPRHRRDPANEE